MKKTEQDASSIKDKSSQNETNGVTRRDFVKGLGLGLAGSGLLLTGAGKKPEQKMGAPAVVKGTELVHWSWLSASDGEVWREMIDDFNKAHAGDRIKIRFEQVLSDQYVTKILTAVTSNQAPDFGWGTGGMAANLARDGVTVALDSLVKPAGLDLADFDADFIRKSRYPKYDNGLFIIPMDIMCLQPMVNVDHLREAGLDPDQVPTTDEEYLNWQQGLTVRDGDKVVRSGLGLVGKIRTSTWGVVAEQMGFRRASDDLTEACVNPEAGIAAMEWILDRFDRYKVASRDLTDRFKAFGSGQLSIFFEGPWAIPGFYKQGLNFKTIEIPKIGKDHITYLEIGGLEMYRQKDKGRYQATMQAIKWLSDNSLKWTTVGRGATPRASIKAMPEYFTSGPPASMREAFLKGIDYATVGEIPVTKGSDFTIYSSTNFLAKILDQVWERQKSPATAMDELKRQWQANLDSA